MKAPYIHILDSRANLGGEPSTANQPPFPGNRGGALLQVLGRYVIAEPFPFVLDLDRCEGMWLATVDGQRLFDWAG